MPRHTSNPFASYIYFRFDTLFIAGNKDIRKMLCKVDRKIAHKVEGMIIKDFMEVKYIVYIRVFS